MRRAALAAALLLAATAQVKAHTAIAGVGGFPGGVLHPLLVPAHALTLIALGLLAGCYDGRRQIALSAVFGAAAAAAFALIAMAFSAYEAETIVLCLGAATGLLLAAGLVPPVSIAALPAAAIAGAVIFDSVPPVPSASETALALTGTALSALALIAATAFISGALPQRIRPLGRRIAGSWIAASAIMVLALRLSA
jgi:urease accessory protein